MRRIRITVDITDDAGRGVTKFFDSAHYEKPHKSAMEWVDTKIKNEAKDIENAPKSAPYKTRGINEQ